MHTIVLSLFVTVATVAASQDPDRMLGSPTPDFSSLKPPSMALANREVAIYRVRAQTLPPHRYLKPVVIVWTREAIVAEQKDGGASTTREVRIGQIDLYPSGTTHSLRALKGSMHFTLIELKQSLRSPKELPTKPEVCGHVVEFPEGGFACLLEMAPNQQVSIPELDVNSFSIAIDSGKVWNRVARSDPWMMRYREGQPSYNVGYEPFAIQNLERRPLHFVLIVPPPAEYN